MIDIIIPVHNQTRLVRACLESVLRAIDPERHEVIVIDDCSTEPELRSYLSKCATGRRITLLTNPENLGFTRSVNRGMAFHQDRDVILLNSDTVVYGDWTDRLAAAAYADQRIATANPLTNASHIGCYPKRAPDGDVRFEITDEQLDELAKTANAGRVVHVHTTVGFCMFIKRACLREVGLFDHVHFPLGYGEESDFCYRAMKLGWHHVVCGDVFVRHWEGRSFGERKAALVAGMLDLFTKLHPDILEKDPEFNARDPIRPLRTNLDLARLRRLLGGRTTLDCVVLPGAAADEVQIIFNSGDATIASLPNLPRFRLPGEIASLNAALRRLGINEIAVRSQTDRDLLARAMNGQAFELGLAARVGVFEDGCRNAEKREKSGVRAGLGSGNRGGSALA